MLPLATVAVLAMTGTKLPASLSCLKKSRPSLTLSRLPPFDDRPAAHTADWAWFDASGSPNSATLFLYSGLSRSGQSFGTLATTLVLTSNDMTPK